MADRIVLSKGQGKDGYGWYATTYPTHYVWRSDIGNLARRLVNRTQFRGRIWINTYYLHPPDYPAEHRSFDVWGFGGRGATLPKDLGAKVFRALFYDPNPPDIWWVIWQGRMWVRGVGWGPSPPGPPGSDAGHYNHIHVTYL